MHRFLTWLLLLGVIAGLGARAMAAVHHHPASHAEHACCDHDHGGDDGDRHDGDGTPGPHHHHVHVCCMPSPLAGPDLRTHRLADPASVRLGVSWLRPLAPEEPVFALDKPPLI